MTHLASDQASDHCLHLDTPVLQTPTSQNVVSAENNAIATLIQAVLTEQPYAGQPIACLGPTSVGLRKSGKLQQTYWRYDTDLEQMVEGVVEQAIASHTDNVRHAEKSGIDAIELCLTHAYRLVAFSEFDRVFTNIHRGIRGIEVQYQNRVYRYSPTRMIAANLSFLKAFQQVLDQESISAQTFIRKGGLIQVFEARQLLIRLTPQVMVTTLHRGNRIVPLENLCGDVLADMTHCMGQWMVRQVQMDGRMMYKYFPSRGEESGANNLIRQFMATLSLIRYARFTQQETHWTLARHNLNYNLKQFYGAEETLGMVEYDGKVKLGAIALAALAILESADAEGKKAHLYPYLLPTLKFSHRCAVRSTTSGNPMGHFARFTNRAIATTIRTFILEKPCCFGHPCISAPTTPIC